MSRAPLLLCFLLAACTKEAGDTRGNEPGVGTAAPSASEEPKGNSASGGVAEPTPAPAPAAATSAVVVARTGLYKTPSKDSKVPDPSGKGTMNNWVTLLHRGDPVTLAKTEGEWAEIDVNGGAHGFAPASAILTAETTATVQEAIVVFDRPDPVAVSKTRLDPGTLLFVLSRKDRFAEVNAKGTKTVWVLGDQLDTTADEVQIARMIEKARYLLEKEKGEGTKELVEVATATFPNAKLLPALKSLVTATSTATPAP